MNYVSSTTESKQKFLSFQVDIGLSLGTNLTYFHHHLMQMLDQYLPGSEKVNFNSLTSTTAILDYLESNFGIGWNPNKNFYTRNKEDLGCHSNGQSRMLGKDDFEKFIDECTEEK